jgi:hypothetical protein
VATCLYLCLDACGLPYGSRLFTDECLLRENIELDNYNTYSSVRHSDGRHTLFLALDGHGAPRRVQVPTVTQKRHNSERHNGKLGRLANYARTLTRFVSPERVLALQERVFDAGSDVCRSSLDIIAVQVVKSKKQCQSHRQRCEQGKCPRNKL